MKKRIIKIILLAFILSNVVSWQKEDNFEVINQNDYVINEDIQKFLSDDAKKIIYDIKTVNNLKKMIADKSKALYNLEAITNFSVLKIQEYIKQADFEKIANFPDYEIIVANLNWDNIKHVTKQFGLIINRTDLRSFPTVSSTPSKFDELSETELSINSPVLVMHESLDGKWYLVMSEIYVGWVLKEDVVLVEENDLNYFVNSQQFGVILEPYQDFDMGVKLPLKKVSNNTVILVKPCKDSANRVVKTNVTIPKPKVSMGYLEFTQENILNQAFKYLDYPYSWGGKAGGIDCSSFIYHLFQTFGLTLPRNTTDQKNSFPHAQVLTGLNELAKLTLLRENSLGLLYRPGHVMLYIGYYQNKPYIIHASGSQRKVVFEELKGSNLQEADKFISIK